MQYPLQTKQWYNFNTDINYKLELYHYSFCNGYCTNQSLWCIFSMRNGYCIYLENQVKYAIPITNQTMIQFQQQYLSQIRIISLFFAWWILFPRLLLTNIKIPITSSLTCSNYLCGKNCLKIKNNYTLKCSYRHRWLYKNDNMNITIVFSKFYYHELISY